MRHSGFLLLACLPAGCGASHTATMPQWSATASTAHAASTAHTAVEVDDTRAWQGTWRLISCTSEGESQLSDLQWVVEGDHYTIRLDGQSHADPYPFKLDSTRKRIDVHHHDTPRGTYGGHFKGIYTIAEDSLKVCYDLKGQAYPASFDARPGSGQVLYQFQRQ